LDLPSEGLRAFLFWSVYKYALLNFYSYNFAIHLDLCYWEVGFAFCAPMPKPIFVKFIKLTEDSKKREGT